ncbi:MAG: ROK family protein, partial [candidate division WOR-3 bacterium]
MATNNSSEATTTASLASPILTSPCRVGIDLGGTNTKIGLVDAQGRIIRRANLLTEPERGPELTFKRIASLLRPLAERQLLPSIGIGIAGLIEPREGIVRISPNLPGWDGTNAKRELERRVGVPVFVANDANAVALGELHFGAGKGYQDIFCMTLGTGVGGAVIVGGRLVLGANQAAGEVGHTIVVPSGQVCRCGSQGCLECYVGAKHIVEHALKKLRELPRRAQQRSLLHQYLTLSEPSPKAIAKADRRGDSLARAIIAEAGNYVGLAILNVV